MIYSFGDYRVDTSRFEIRRAGNSISAQPQVFELLVFLLENRGRFVSRDEIFAAIWKNRVVSDATLSGYIKSVRKLVGDDGREQNIIRTVHGRGFQFVAKVQIDDAEPEPGGADDNRQHPPTGYAKSGKVHIAYQVFGTGPIDLVIVPGFISHIENYWDNPQMSYWLHALGKIARVVIFDKRGTGLSDSAYPLPDFDVRMDDVGAVMDAASLDKAYIMGISEGGSLASLFAAMHPERCSGLILYGAFSRFSHWFPTREDLQGLFDYIEADWGSGQSLPMFAPGVGEDADFKSWWGKFERLGATPGAAIALMQMNSEIDITDILPSISSRTLVIHRRGDVTIDFEGGRLLADKIPNARLVELSGNDHIPWVGNSSEIVSAIADFVEDDAAPAIPDTILTTLLSVRLAMDDSNDAKLLDDARGAIDKSIARYRGFLVNRDDDSKMGSFDGPARATHCACEILARLEPFALQVQCCVHTGEVTRENDRVSGQTVDRLAQIGELAPWGQAVVSDTVKDLIAGAGLKIELQAEHETPGSDARLCLYQVNYASI